MCGSVSLRGDALVVADSCDRAIVVNARSPEDRAVVLESTTISNHPQTVRKLHLLSISPNDLLQTNICLQIQISQRYIIVARAKFVEVFNFTMDILEAEPAHSAIGHGQEPIIEHPVDSFSFGWLDGISISQDTTKPDAFFVLFPQPNEDPWSMHSPTLTLYHLEANSMAGVEKDTPSPPATPGSTPRILSETFLASVPLSASASPTSTSSSTSTKLVLGRHRTALWLSPRPRELDFTGLVQMDLNRQGDWPFQARGVRTWRNFFGDDLIWASFGPRQTITKPQTEDDENCTSTVEGEDSKTPVLTKRILNSDIDEDWAAIGYDEETGRVVLGRRNGCITFLRL